MLKLFVQRHIQLFIPLNEMFYIALLSTLRNNFYLTLVRSNFSYCSQLWRPHLFRDILALERIQRRATKFILQDQRSSYKARLAKLHPLSLSLWLEMHDVLYMVKCLQAPSDNFNVKEYVSFASNSTRAAASGKLVYKYTRTSAGRHEGSATA